MTWQFAMDGSRIPALRVQLEWALQTQNRRFATAFARGAQRTAARISLVLSIVALALIGALAIASPAAIREDGAVFGAFVAIFGGTLALSIVRLRRAGGGGEIRGHAPVNARRIGAGIERDADRTFRRISGLPYTIDYALDETAATVRARVATPRIDRTTQLARAGIVLVGPGLAFVFRRRHSVMPKRLIYLTPEARAAVLALLESRGIAHELVDGPVEGYVAPIAAARAL